MSGISDEQGYTDYAAVALPRLRRIAYLLCQDWHRADDLTQNALTRLYVHWGRARAAEHLDAYVGAILLNVYLAEQRTHWWKRTSVRAQRRQSGGGVPVTVGGHAALLWTNSNGATLSFTYGVARVVIQAAGKEYQALGGRDGFLTFCRSLRWFGADPTHWTTNVLG